MLNSHNLHSESTSGQQENDYPSNFPMTAKSVKFPENRAILDRLKTVRGWEGHGANKLAADFLEVGESTFSGWYIGRNPIDYPRLARKLTPEQFFLVITGRQFGGENGGAPFPEDEIRRAVVLSKKILGENLLPPEKEGRLVAAIAGLLWAGRTEQELLERASPVLIQALI